MNSTRQSNKRTPARHRSEKSIVNEILKWLRGIGAKAIKTTPPGVEAGTPDILGCWRGRAFAIECKRPGEDATPLQKHRLAQWADAGALVCVADSLEKVQILFDAARPAGYGSPVAGPSNP